MGWGAGRDGAQSQYPTLVAAFTHSEIMNIISPSAKKSHCLGEIKLFRVTTYFDIILVIQCTLEPMYIPVFDEGHSLKFYRSQFTNRLYILGYRSSCLG